MINKKNILKKINDVHNQHTIRYQFKSIKDLDSTKNTLLHIYFQGDYFVDFDISFYKLSKTEINYLIYNSNLKQKNGDQNTILHIVFAKNIDFLSEKTISYIIRNSNLKAKNFLGETPLATYLSNNKRIKLSQKNLNYLLKNSNLNSKDELYYMTTAMSFFLQRLSFILNEKQLEFLIKKSNLTTKDRDGWNLPCHILFYMKTGQTKNIPISQKSLDLINKEILKYNYKNLETIDSELIDIIKKTQTKFFLEKKLELPNKTKQIVL